MTTLIRNLKGDMHAYIQYIFYVSSSQYYNEAIKIFDEMTSIFIRGTPFIHFVYFIIIMILIISGYYCGHK